jgi:putative LysE/RhtB family amino acid efflux pump
MVGLTLTNPSTIISSAALFAGIGAGIGAGTGGSSLVTAGVFLGSVGWWALLTGITARLRARLTPRVIRSLNLASADVIATS